MQSDANHLLSTVTYRRSVQSDGGGRAAKVVPASASAAGLRNQTGVNSHLTLTHISTSTEAKTPSQTVNSTFPQPPLSWNEGHMGATGALPSFKAAH